MKNFLEKVQKKGPAGRKRSDRKENRTRQKNKRGNSKLESHDSPEIPDRGETLDIPSVQVESNDSPEIPDRGETSDIPSLQVESNDSPEIPDRRETSDIPSLPSGNVMTCNCANMV